MICGNSKEGDYLFVPAPHLSIKKFGFHVTRQGEKGFCNSNPVNMLHLFEVKLHHLLLIPLN